MEKRTQKISIPYIRDMQGQLLGTRGVPTADGLSILRCQTSDEADQGRAASSPSYLAQTSQGRGAEASLRLPFTTKVGRLEQKPPPGGLMI